MKNFLKRMILVFSGLWVIATIYCVYAVTYGILTLDWHRFIYGIIVWVVVTLLLIVISLAAD
jgi:hypothetical protein